MRTTLSFALSFALASSLAQQAVPLRSDCRKLLELLPKGPANIADARARCSPRNTASDNGYEAVMAPFDKALQTTQDARITAGGATAGGMSSSQEAMMQKMQDPAFQEEMKKMSPQQIAELMMRMQGGSLPMGGSVSDEEGALAEEFDRLNGEAMTYGTAFNEEWAVLLSDLGARTEVEREVLRKERGDCAWYVSGETKVQDEACVRGAMKRYAARMEVVLDAWLPKANAFIDRYRADVTKHYEEAEKRLVAVGYGDECGTQMFLDMVINTQTFILGSVESVGGLAKQVWFTVCREKDWLDNPTTN